MHNGWKSKIVPGHGTTILIKDFIIGNGDKVFVLLDSAVFAIEVYKGESIDNLELFTNC